jgi:serine/threonine protein kinase
MDPLLPGDPVQVGGYRLLGRLGAGGMGEVFLGRSAGGRQVAVKLVRPEHAGNGKFRDRFAREVEAARRVGGFHTAPVVDADPDADPPWMVTAYIPGPSLREAVVDHGPLTLEEVRALGAGLAEGLAAIHACDLVHRDLKPGNVILAADGPRIIDFGIARTLDASAMTQTGAVLGTFAYMSPEQVRGDRVTSVGDVFSLGSVLAFAATGHSPFGAGSIATIVHRITSRQPDLTDLPEGHGLRGLIIDCLAKNPADRPALSDILARLTEPDTGNIRPPSPAADALTSRASQSSPSRGAVVGDTGRPSRRQTRETADHVRAEDIRHPDPPGRPGRPDPVEPDPARNPIRRRTILFSGLAAIAAVGIPATVILSEPDKGTGVIPPVAGHTDTPPPPQKGAGAAYRRRSRRQARARAWAGGTRNARRVGISMVR